MLLLILDDSFLLLDQELNLGGEHLNICKHFEKFKISHRLLFKLIAFIVIRVNSVPQSHPLIPVVMRI